MHTFAMPANRDELWDLVRSIPPGQVSSYGSLGALLSQPTSGRIVGRMMVDCPEDVPWWRVVAKTGGIPIWKQGPEAGIRQEELLKQEGVEIENGLIPMKRFEWAPF
jgi:methylated-DNA-protein-cysteine methyltransferase related protein